MFKIIEMSKIRSGENIRNEKDDDILANTLIAKGMIVRISKQI